MLSLNSQSGRKPILGIRAEGGEEDEFDQLFSGSSDDEQWEINLASRAPAVSTAPTCSLNSISKLTDVSNFEEVSKPIAALTATLEEYLIPQYFSGQFDLLPERIAPQPLIDSITKYARNHNFEEFEAFVQDFDYTQLPDLQVAQIQLALYSGNKSVNLQLLSEFNLDPRVSSILHFEIAKTCEDQPSKALAYYLNSAVDFVKSNSMAPVSILFPDFNLSNILTNLCKFLIKMFPRHPLIPSIVHKLSGYTKDKDEVIALLPNEEPGGDCGLALSLFSDDDSFSELKGMQMSQGGPLSLEYDDTPVDNLDLSTIPQPIEVVVFPDTPTTATYLLMNGSDRMRQNDFVQWVKDSSSTAKPTPVVVSPVDAKDEQTKAWSLPPAHTLMFTRQKKDVNFTTLYQEMVDGGDLTIEDESSFDPSQYALILPLMHWINIKADKPYTNTVIAPRLLTAEFRAHKSLCRRDKKQFEDALSMLYMHIPTSLPIAPLESLVAKRPLPPLIGEFNSDVISMMALIDCHLMMEGRSPLTLQLYNCSLVPDVIAHPIADKKWRIQALYSLYTRVMFPPYLSFRAAFAIAISILDYSPVFATKLLFEGLYMLLFPFPVFRKSIWCNVGFFAFGEALNATGSYPYAALAHDNSLPLSDMDPRLATKAGQIAQRRKDPLRAVYHYLQAMKMYLSTEPVHTDEALFTAQVVASIYLDNYQYIEGIKLLNSIMMNTYHFSVRMARSKAELFGSLKCNKRNIFIQSGQPTETMLSLRPDSINSILTAAFLCQFLVKLNQCSTATNLLHRVIQMAASDAISRILSFLELKVAYASGNLDLMLKTIKESDLPLQSGRLQRGSSTKFFKFSLLAFDTRLASLKVLAKAYLERDLGFHALFWSEMICHNASKNSLASCGIGFHLRAQALITIHSVSHAYDEEFPIAYPLSPLEASVGHFANKDTVTRHVVLQEAFASFEYARACYEKVGNIPKILESSVQYLEALIEHFFVAKILDQGNAESMVVQVPSLYAHLNNMEPEELFEIRHLNITWANLVEVITPISNNVRQLAKTLMDPIFIIRSQIIEGFLAKIEGEEEKAEEFFSFALNNFRKYYFVDTTFIMRELRIRHMQQIKQGLQSLITLLYGFSPEFINKNLVAFDLYNEIKALVSNTKRVTVYEPTLRIGEQTKRQPSLVELANVSYPDFLEILKEKNYIGGSKPKPILDRNWQLIILFGKIRSTCRHFALGELPEQRMTERNVMNCRNIESIMAEERKARRRTSVLPSDLPLGAISPYLFVNTIKNRICVYVPMNGFKNIVRMERGRVHCCSLTIDGKNTKFNFGSSLFSESFLRAMMNIITTTAHKSDTSPVRSNFLKFCDSLAITLFGKETTTTINEQRKYTPILDNNSFGKFSLFRSGLKGNLSTLSVGTLPITVVADCDTQYIPFEFLFRQCVVIRSNGFYTSYMKVRRANLPYSVTVQRWQDGYEASAIEKACASRSLENVMMMLFHSGSGPPPTVSVHERERIGTIPLTLFNHKKDTQYYSMKYKFANIIQVRPEMIPDVENYIDSIFLMSYIDLIEWPEALDSLVKEGARSSFLFVPSSHIHSAFQLLRNIFKRHKRRSAYFKDHPEDKDAEITQKLMDSPLQFVGTLQATLMQTLNVPVAMIVYSRDN